MKKTIKLSNKWEEMTLGQWLKIEEIYNSSIEAEDKTSSVIAVLANCDKEDIDNLNIQDFYILAQQLDFLKTPISRTRAKDKVKLGDVIYDVTLDLSKVSVAQYFDFQSFMKRYQETNDINDLLSIYCVFLIPEGKKYNEGYDQDDIKKEIVNLGLEEATGIVDFFRQYFLQYTKTMLRYLKKKTPKKELKNLLEELKIEMKRL